MKQGKPNQVSIGVTLLWVVTVVGAITIIFNFSKSLEVANSYGFGSKWLMFTLGFSLLLSAFLIWKIGNGRNWARIAYLAIFILGSLFTLYGYFTSEISKLIIILGVVGMVMQAIALELLFRKSSSDWFKLIASEDSGWKMTGRPSKASNKLYAQKIESKRELSIWEIIGLIIIIIVAYKFIFGSDEKYDSYCVDDCVMDLDLCRVDSIIYDRDTNGYISEQNYDRCKYELESCISDCEP